MEPTNPTTPTFQNNSLTDKILLKKQASGIEEVYRNALDKKETEFPDVKFSPDPDSILRKLQIIGKIDD